jgi:hypothetical protein
VSSQWIECVSYISPKLQTLMGRKENQCGWGKAGEMGNFNFLLTKAEIKNASQRLCGGEREGIGSINVANAYQVNGRSLPYPLQFMKLGPASKNRDWRVRSMRANNKDWVLLIFFVSSNDGIWILWRCCCGYGLGQKSFWRMIQVDFINGMQLRGYGTDYIWDRGQAKCVNE